ncbi:ESCRT-II complex subunit [Coniochaeta sp. 2T2.1]|nr:ESCRT-II complex subunit [Coniochaeta sp. 2T2.1]
MTTQQPQPFPFPREFFFPPFFTRQTNLTTHHAQLVKWSSLILSYCRHYRIFKLSLSPVSSSTTSNPFSSPTTTSATDGQQLPQPGSEHLFHNPRIDRRLSLADIKETIEFMRKDGRAEYVGGGGGGGGTSSGGGGGMGQGGGGGDVVWIYWRTPEEWASLIEEWVDGTAQKGTVLTLYELVEGEGTRGAEFHGLDADLLQKALGILVKRGKAQIFGQEDSRGVKFF